MSAVAAPRIALSGHDLYLYREGTHSRLYEKLGAHLVEGATEFAVWAPNAASVAVVGDFNGWDPRKMPMRQTGDASGIWEGRVPEAGQGSIYKYHIVSQAFRLQSRQGRSLRVPLRDAAEDRVRGLGPRLRLGRRRLDARPQRANALDAPLSIYEVHLGSWMRSPDNPGGFLGYRELAPQLAEYAKRLGFTHVELMPSPSIRSTARGATRRTGYFAPTSRYGTPQDFMYFVDTCTSAGIGVILDWVPSHFPDDAHGLGVLRRHAPLRARRPAPGLPPRLEQRIFNYGRNEVRAFLSSSALFWLEKYHIDGLRVDAVASMLYLDYGRKHGRVDPQPLRRPREPRGDRLPARAQRDACTATIPTSRRSPRNRPPGRWCRGRPTSAASASA